MPRKQNKVYSKQRVFRDHRKFVIIAEGDREDDYFGFFNEINRRIKIVTVPRDKGKSACKFFLERLHEYNIREGIEHEDLIWFITDVDKWERSEIDSLQAVCLDNPNYNLAISNPCFEVWLYFHYSNPETLKTKTPKHLKTKLGTIVQGGYNKKTFCLRIDVAAKSAKKSDKHPKHYFPVEMNTKVYNLAEEMLKFLGKNWIDNIS